MIKKKVIIDCDPGIDDFLALLLALNCENLDILGITIVGGNVDLYKCGENALKVLELTNSLNIPVYLGAEKPLYKTLGNAEEVHGADGLGNTNLPKVENVKLYDGAEDFIIKTLKENEGVSIISLAPMTNIAKAIMKNKEAFKNLDEFISMGGTYKELGNCTKFAEFNYYIDPHAANYVYENLKTLNKKICMIGLDVTTKVILTPSMIEFIKKINGKLSSIVVDITKFYMDFYWDVDKVLGCILNDPLAVAYFIDHSICKGFPANTNIIEEGEKEGATLIKENEECNSIILDEVDVEKFFQLFIRTLLKDKKEDVDKYIKVLKLNK